MLGAPEGRAERESCEGPHGRNIQRERGDFMLDVTFVMQRSLGTTVDREVSRGAAVARWSGMRLIPHLAVVAVLSSCSLFMHSIEKPSAKVREVSVSAAGFTGATGELRLDVSNPNGFGVPLASIDWQLDIGGAPAARGSVSLTQTIPARGVAPIVASLTIEARDAIAVATKLAAGARDYRLVAKVKFSTPVGSLAVDLEHAGQLGGGGGGVAKAVAGRLGL